MRPTRNVLGVASVLLVTFHGWLLATQFADGRLVDPWVVARWIIAAGLVASFVAIRRQGSSLFSRRSVTIWVLAALLHGPAVAADFGGALDSPALPEAVATIVLQATTAAVLSLGLWILAGLFAKRDRRPRFFSQPVLAVGTARILAGGFSPPFSPRPPPRA